MNNWKVEIEAEGLAKWLDQKNKVYWLQEILVKQNPNLREIILQNKKGGINATN